MESTFKDEVTASEILPVNHSEFAKYTIREFLPNYIDGLKLVYRRLLWILGTNASKQKCAKLIADTMGGLHPHGDQGLYTALIRLCQGFSQCLPLIESPGNTGAYGGARAAAPRYLDVTRAEFAADLFFNRVNSKTFTYIPNELNNGVEPECFIPVFPTALITGINSIGVGFKSIIPFYNFESICTLVVKYIGLRKDAMFNPKVYYQELSKYLIPDFPTHSLIRNVDEIMEKYGHGDFEAPIMTDGCMEVFPGRISLNTIPYGNAFQQVLDKLKQEMSKPSFISANVNEVSNLIAATDIGNIKITLKRGVDVFEILDELKRQLGFTKSYTPIWNFSDNEGTVYNMTPFQLIEKWYIERYRSILGDLKITQRELNTRKREIEAKVIVIDHTDDVTNIVKTSSTSQEAIFRLVNRFKDQKLTSLQAEYILSLSLAQLTREGKDKLLADLESVTNKIKEHTDKFKDIDKIIIEDINRLKLKYGPKITRKCIVPDYIACLHINKNGIVQVRSLQELAHQLRRWGNEQVMLEAYPAGKNYHVKYLDNKGYLDTPICFPKVFKAHAMKTTKYKPKNTVVLSGGQIFRIEAMARPLKGMFIPCGDEFMGVTNKGVVKLLSCKDIPKRQAIDALGVQTDLRHISSTVCDKPVVAYYDPKQVNEIHLARVEIEDKLPMSVLSKPVVIGIYRETDPIAISVDDSILNRCTTKHLYFKDAQSVMDDEKHIVIYLSRRNTSNKKNLVQIIKNIELYGIQHLSKIKNEYEFM